MAKVGTIEKNEKRKSMAKRDRAKREALKEVISNKELPLEDRFQAQLKLASLPRNGAFTRYRRRCELTGRPRGVYRKFKLARVILRDLSVAGMLPGVKKASW